MEHDLVHGRLVELRNGVTLSLQIPMSKAAVLKPQLHAGISLVISYYWVI